jgi:hypothetical protein
MNLQQRLEFLPHQKRAYIQGTIEHIHDQWVFFDEQDEALSLNEVIKDSLEIKILGKWVPFYTIDNGVAFGEQSYSLKHGDVCRIQKPLPFIYKEWLSQISEESLHQFVLLLNQNEFSLYDCIYCHNYMYFLVGKTKGRGVNFLIFDNEEQICSIHHHFNSNSFEHDKFELTLSNGTRQFIMKSKR